MKTVTHIVETYIGYDRPTWIPNPEWIKWRADFFHKYTLRSLRNQSFKDFRIFVQCGNRNREMIENYDWAPELSICFDNGKNQYDKIDTDYIATSRLDSDDLMHKDAMQEIHDNLIFSDRREVLAFFTWRAWNIQNNFIRKTHIRSSSPFFTHIFPRSIYKNWKLFMSQHFLAHGSGGAGDRGGKRLSEHKICITRHSQNTSHLKKGIQTHPMNEIQLEEFKAKWGSEMTFNKEEMYEILKDFGMPKEMI